MRNFLSADAHFGHDNIIKYCGRPFKDVVEMNEKMIKLWNEKTKPGDVVYHIGDFCFHGGDQGGKTKAQFWEQQLNAKIVHVRGNHDVNNGVRALITDAIMHFGDLIFFVTHVPPTMKLEVPEFCDAVICGHVHEKWKFQYDSKSSEITVPIINVGVDVWKFQPVEINDLIGFYYQIINGKADVK